MKLTLFITLLFFIFVSCKKEKVYQPVQISCNLTKDLDSCKALIKGSWTWLEEKRASFTQLDYQYLTPKNQGITRILKFSNDTARFFKNNLPDSVYTFKILRLAEISGTNFPEDNDPIIVYYNLHNGLRRSFVPLKICHKFLLLQHQFVSSVVGEQIWAKQ